MNGTILVPLDGSRLAEQGLYAACRVAKDTQAGLLLLTAVPFSTVAGTEEREKERAALRDAHEHLRYQQQAVAAEGLSAHTLVLPGDPVHAILFAAEERRVDLISMATHGRSGLRQALLGSVAAAIVRGTRTPILLSRAAGRPGLPETAPYRRIVAPLDGTPIAEIALQYLQAQGLGDAGELLLLRAVASAQAYPASPLVPPGEVDMLAQRAEEVTEQRRREAEAYLQTLCAERLSGRPCRLVVAVDSPAAAIVDTVSRDRADLIVLATHDRHGVDRLLHGSVAHQVLQHADVPVLLLHGTVGTSEQKAVTVTAAEAWPAPDEVAGEPIARGQVEHPNIAVGV
jgi:nucleotide-binding universal stress UspA family protein